MMLSLSLSLPLPSLASARAPTPREAAAQARSDARLKESRAAVETLKQIDAPKAQADERKAAALKKVADLKAQIRSLQMTAALDPEGTARLAARLARELGQAVKAYASAGGSAADLGPTAPAAPVAQAQPSGDSAGMGVPTAAAIERTPVQAGGGSVQSPASATSTPSAPDTGQDRQDTASATTDAPDDLATPRDPYRQAIAAIEAQGTYQALRAGEARGNAEFVTEVKRLAAELKSIIRNAARQIQAQDVPASKAQAEDAEKALKVLDGEIADAERQLEADVGGGLGTMVGTGVPLLI